jgi:hypothetical protein
MPSHTIHSALTKMHGEADGTPWNCTQWKLLTGVYHGLFPTDDKHLPEGWTCRMADEIASYFDQFNNKMTDEEKIKFASSKSEIPGRKSWCDWVNKLWKEHHIHDKIIDVLSSENLHPYTLSSQNDSPDIWPDANQFVPLAVDPVGLALFGEDCLAGDRVRMNLRDTTKALITRTWLLLYTNRTRSQKRVVALEAETIKAFQG